MLKNIFHNCLSLLLFLSFLFSQTSPEKRLDAKYYLVSYTKFKEGKKQEGMEIIQKYFPSHCLYFLTAQISSQKDLF